MGDEVRKRAGAVGLVLALVGVHLAVTAPSAAAATLVADYRFQDSLASTGGSAPALTSSGSTSFIDEVINRQKRRALRFPTGSSLSLQTSGVVPSNSYSIAMLFRFEAITQERRLIDFKTPAANEGLYLLHGQVYYYPAAATGPVVAANEYVQVVVTRDASNATTLYVAGSQISSFSDTSSYGVISGGVLRFFKDEGNQDAPGAVARIRVWDGPLSAAEVSALDDTPAPCNGDANSRCDAEGGAVVADYGFQGTLDSTGSAPPLTAGTAGSFVTQAIHDQRRTVYKFPQGSSLVLPTRGLIESTSYSVAVLFRFEAITQERRLMDFKTPGANEGLYLHNGQPYFYPAAPQGDAIDPTEWAQLVITRDRNRNVTIYMNGTQASTFKDTAGYTTVDPGDTIRFFKDEGSQDAAGAVARIRLFDGPLDAASVSALDDMPPVCPGGSDAPCQTATPAAVADYRFEGDLGNALGGDPSLVEVGAGASFAQETIDGKKRDVRTFPAGTGLELRGVRALVEPVSYSVAVLFRFDAITQERRLMDFKTPGANEGLYLFNGQPYFYPAAPQGDVIDPGAWAQLVITRDRNRNVTIYMNGTQASTFKDTAGYTTVDPGDTLRFFKDEGSQDAAGAVARIRLFNGPLTAQEVKALDRAASTVPSCAGDPDTICGTTGDDTIQGTNGDDTIVAGEGDNTIIAGEGSDTITTGNGDDTVIGGGGDDRITTGGGDDVIVGDGAEDPQARRVLQARPVYVQQTATAGNDIVDSGTGNDEITTGFGTDNVKGADGKDELFAQGDDDTLDGGGGNDRLDGGPGKDKLNGGKGKDFCFKGPDDTLKACEKVKRNNM